MITEFLPTMNNYTIICITITLLPLTYILQHYIHNLYRSYHKRPLQVLGLPVLGSALTYSTKPDAFLAQCTKQYGYMFKLQLGPTINFTFLTDILSMSTIYKSKLYDFHAIATTIMQTVFKQSSYSAGKLDHMFYPQYIKYLQASELEQVTPNFQYYYIKYINERLHRQYITDTDKWLNVSDLNSIVGRMMFYVTINSLWNGNNITDRTLHTAELYNDQLYNIYKEFDNSFPLIAANVPYMFSKKGHQAMNELFVQLDYHYKHCNKQTLSNFMTARYNTFDNNVDLLTQQGNDTASINLAFLFATVANQLPNSYWVLIHILFDTDAYNAVRHEIDTVLNEHGNKPLDRTVYDKLVVLDSCINEAMRINSSSTLIREVTENHIFTTSDKQQYQLCKGDIVSILTTQIHHNADIYPQPEKYVYNRFLLANTLPPHKAIKYINPNYKGTKLPLSQIFLSFGAGHSLCPGRYFAKHVMKTMLLNILCMYDIELTGKSKLQLPDKDISRVGLGVLPVKGDVSVRIKRRTVNPLQGSNDALWNSMHGLN